MSVDTFINNATHLLSAYPSSTVSITYTKSKTKPGNITKFKVYNPRSNKSLKYKTNKIKEFSRLLTFLGPNGVNIELKHSVGLSSLMSNKKFELNDTKLDTKEDELKEDNKINKKKKKKSKK